MTDPAEIAATLTKAQRCAMTRDWQHWAKQHQGKINSPSITVARVLHRLGLIDAPARLTWPTTLGLAVRAELMKDTK